MGQLKLLGFAFGAIYTDCGKCEYQPLHSVIIQAIGLRYRGSVVVKLLDLDPQGQWFDPTIRSAQLLGP